MAVSDAFLTTCRTIIAASAELTAFRAALLLLDGASATNRRRYWQAAFGDQQAGLSPAYRLRAAIRSAVSATATSGTPPLDAEAAYRQLVGEYIPDLPQPPDGVTEAAELQALLLEDQLS